MTLEARVHSLIDDLGIGRGGEWSGDMVVSALAKEPEKVIRAFIDTKVLRDIVALAIHTGSVEGDSVENTLKQEYPNLNPGEYIVALELYRTADIMARKYAGYVPKLSEKAREDLERGIQSALTEPLVPLTEAELTEFPNLPDFCHYCGNIDPTNARHCCMCGFLHDAPGSCDSARPASAYDRTTDWSYWE